MFEAQVEANRGKFLDERPFDRGKIYYYDDNNTLTHNEKVISATAEKMFGSMPEMVSVLPIRFTIAPTRDKSCCQLSRSIFLPILLNQPFRKNRVWRHQTVRILCRQKIYQTDSLCLTCIRTR